MALPSFKSFYPDVVRWMTTRWEDRWKAIVDSSTGALIGLQSQNANGPDGIWAPTPLSSAQIGAPTPAMLADLNATYQENQAPYSRYYSDGTQLVPMSGQGGTIIPPGQIELRYSPLTVTEASGPLIDEGGLVIIAQPA